MSAPCLPGCTEPRPGQREHVCSILVGETGGPVGERLAVDLVQRFDPTTGTTDRQIGVVDVETDQGVSFTLERLGELLELIEQARARSAPQAGEHS